MRLKYRKFLYLLGWAYVLVYVGYRFNPFNSENDAQDIKTYNDETKTGNEYNILEDIPNAVKQEQYNHHAKKLDINKKVDEIDNTSKENDAQDIKTYNDETKTGNEYNILENLPNVIEQEQHIKQHVNKLDINNKVDEIDNASKDLEVDARFKKIRMCTQAERLHHLEKMCPRTPLATIPDMMTPPRLSILDDKHQIYYCWMSKIGCSAFKNLFEVAGGRTPNQNMRGKALHSVNTLNKYGIWEVWQLTNVSQEVIWNKIHNYFAFFNVRHPMERFFSAYRDKIAGRGTDYPQFPRRVLRYNRKELFEHNKTLNDMKFPQSVLGPPTFAEFAKWFKETKGMNEHWSLIIKSCHPCAHNWSAIFRIETMETDSKLLLDRLKPDISFDQVPVVHSRQRDPEFNKFAKRMPEYDDLDDDLVQSLVDFYQIDMDMFGYRWDMKSRTMYCQIDTPNGPCC